MRHLPSFGREVQIGYRPKGYECPHCDGNRKSTQELAWHRANSPYTCAYEDYLLKALINSTVEEVSWKEGVGRHSLWNLVERGIGTPVDWSCYQDWGVLGIDEIALKKGHRDFVVMVSARLDTGDLAVLGVLPDREKQTVEAFLRSIPASLQATIHSVCVDMYEGYPQAVKLTLPNAQGVVDRFHVAKLYRQAADKVRQTEMKRLKKSLPKADYATLKPCRHAFWKNRLELTPEQQQALKRLFAYAPKLFLIQAFRESLRTIFEQPLSKAQAQDELRTWLFLVREQNITCFESFLETLTHVFDEITNFFVRRLTSGFVEGLNNKIKVLKRRAFGIFNLEHFFQRLFLDLQGHPLFA